MTKKLVVAVLAAPFVILAIVTLFCAAASCTSVSDEEYAVYASFLQSEVETAEYGHDWALQHCPLCGGGGYAILVRDGEVWTVSNVVALWYT